MSVDVTKLPPRFSGSRERRTKGINVRALHDRKNIRRFPIDNELSPPRKKSRYADESTVVLAKDYHYEEEIRFISPGTDPSTLCPYCDRPLPAERSQKLMRLLTVMESRSEPDPRPANPLGRKAPVTIYAVVCHRHAFESETMSEALACGWPTSIVWEELPVRVRAMKSDLEKIVADAGPPIIYKGQDSGALEPTAESSGPRMRCIFWRELLELFKTVGMRGVSNTVGQMNIFKKFQPGYYGERGYVLIHQTLYTLFPPTSIDPNLTGPLSPRDFIAYILVPEVGMRLILEDMSLDAEAVGSQVIAAEAMRASASYGVEMFPEEDAELFNDDGDLFSWEHEVEFELEFGELHGM
ncbi:RTC4-like domain-containing protein [Mycena metata]|uniref:Restriction of telomere capping protein 4 n=1 Tax=Mycena metata TaxID=1033252 RepID=A0AAD7JRZ6_9AGAR|nr:RTC4-like domain-containing protein [Mycena metata]